MCYDTDNEHNALRKDAFVSALSWIEEEGTSKYVGGEKNRVVRLSTLFDHYY